MNRVYHYWLGLFGGQMELHDKVFFLGQTRVIFLWKVCNAINCTFRALTRETRTVLDKKKVFKFKYIFGISPFETF